MAAKFKKGDRVKVITGKSKGVVGIITKVCPKEHSLIVEGANIGRKRTNSPTGVRYSDQEKPIHVSNVMHIDPKTSLPTRIGYKLITLENGESAKVRYAKKSQEYIDKV